MSETGFRLHELSRLDDPLLLPWLDLYETSFPPNEKVLVSDHLRVLHRKAQGEGQGETLLAAVDPAGTLGAMARYEVCRDPDVAWLWYLAVRPELRNRGLGAWIYRHLLGEIAAAGLEAALFEVEIPTLAHSEEERRFAERRIHFYRRLGAFLVEGIDYEQSVGSHCPPTPMHLMVHPFRQHTADEWFDLLDRATGGSVRRTGRLALT